MKAIHVPISQLIQGVIESSPYAEYKVGTTILRHGGENQFIITEENAAWDYEIWDSLPEAIDYFLIEVQACMDTSPVEIYCD